MFNTKVILPLVAASAIFTGCASTGADPNYLARLDAQKAIETVRAQAELERAKSETARMVALQRIGETGDTQARQMAVMALAVLNNGNGGNNLPAPQSNMPSVPESGSDKALKWAAVFAGPLTNIASGYFGYRLGVAQSDNNAATTIAGYNSFSTIANSGFTSASAIANSGFNATSQLGSYIQAPQPNITLSGSGVVGSGTHNVLSGTGVLGSGSYVGPVTRNCVGGSGAAGGNGAAGGLGGAGGAGTTTGGAGAAGGLGGAGAPGGLGGSAAC